MSTFAALSVDDGFRAGGLGLGEVDVEGGATSCLGVEVPDAGCELIPLSDLIASFVENIGVMRFFINIFSDIARLDPCGLEGGVACQLRLSGLETAMLVCLVAWPDWREPIADDVCEAVRGGWPPSAKNAILTAVLLTVGRT